ncbi:PIG-L deacetylase family protein [Candidatus Pelagibacter sp.]|uniref:PIG-L deacetylase family protein n=1 Tax=Candidatus Pelagibacter sp. TaxID=2024849 RepID=UPI003F837089
MREKILVIAAHPDDEVLGCGATIAKKILKEKAIVNTLIMSKGILSRENIKNKKKDLIKNIKMAQVANKLIGVKKLQILDFPDNEFDNVPILNLIKEIEIKIKSFLPDTIYTHFHGDLNIDHQMVARAVLTACRPTKKNSVRKIFAFEVLSSTDYHYGVQETFVPNHFECINKTINLKLKALKKYDHEMRTSPHSRSYENVLNLAKLRGSQMFENFAESFMVTRSFSR